MGRGWQLTPCSAFCSHLSHTPRILGRFSTCPALSHPTSLVAALHPLSSPGSWLVNPALTVHPGIRTQGANAGRGLGGVANGLAGGPGVKIDVDGHGRAGEHQEPDDGQDVGNAHKLQGAGQSRAQPWLPMAQATDRGARGSPGRAGRGAGGDCDALHPALHHCQSRRGPRQVAQASSPGWGLLQLTGAGPVPDPRPAGCARGD